MQQSPSHHAPARLLAGIRVLDLTNVLAGPFAGYQLAQLGAEVIKVEVPGSGDLARQLGADADLNARKMGASFLAQNAGKRSLTLNLKAEAGKALFRRLVASADVVLENFRPGVMDRLGLGAASLLADKPDLIYCAISGFGADGPWRDKPAYDQIVQGLSGVMSVTGDQQTAPLRVGYPVADTIGGLTAAFAIAGALIHRGRTGEGQIVDVSMLESVLATMGWQVSNYLTTGRPPVPMGNENMTAAPSGLFRTADKPLNIAANKQEQFETLCRLAGRAELIDDPRFAEREARKANRAALTVELEQALTTRPAAEWEAMLTAAGVPAGRVLTIPEVLAEDQVAGRAVVRDLGAVAAAGRDVKVTRGGFRLSGGDPGPQGPPPTLGQDTEALLKELGADDDEIAQWRAAGVI